MKFLVVDDDARFRRMMKDVLAEVAESVHECNDGSEARNDSIRNDQKNYLSINDLLTTCRSM
jgi:CheY-like chemotaxis protein